MIFGRAIDKSKCILIFQFGTKPNQSNDEYFEKILKSIFYVNYLKIIIIV